MNADGASVLARHPFEVVDEAQLVPGDHLGIGVDVRRWHQNDRWGWLDVANGRFYPDIKGGSRQFWSECLAWATATGTPVANLAVETVLFPNVTIPGNFMQDGRALRLTAYGSYGTTATPALTFTLRWGGVSGTVIGKSFAAVTTSGVGGGASMTAMWSFDAVIQTRSNGASGSLMSNGQAILYTSTLPTAGTVTQYGMPVALASGATGGTTPVAVTADLTADTALSFTALWGTSAAANSIQGLNYYIEAMN